MSEHGAALQTYNQELVKCLEDLKTRKNEIMDVVYREEAESIILQKNIKALQDKLNILNQNLEHHKQMYDSYDNTIRETEAGFKKILESSQALLNSTQYEVSRLDGVVHNNSPNSKPIVYQFNQNGGTDY